MFKNMSCFPFLIPLQIAPLSGDGTTVPSWHHDFETILKTVHSQSHKILLNFGFQPLNCRCKFRVLLFFQQKVAPPVNLSPGVNEYRGHLFSIGSILTLYVVPTSLGMLNHTQTEQ